MVGGVLVGSLSVLLLNNLTTSNKSYGGGFRRSVALDFLQEKRVLDIKFDSYYISGTTGGRIYLGNMVAPLHMLSVGKKLDTASHRLKIVGNSKIARKALHVMVDSNSVFAVERLTPAILRGSTTDLNMTMIEMEKSIFLANPVVSRCGKVFVKTYASDSHKSLLSKIVLNPASRQDCDILLKQIDGIFCTDGMLIYNAPVDRLIYVYFYRNSFISLDTNLNIKYTARTIDTVTKVHFQVGKISSENTFTLSSPPSQVNKKSFAFKDWVFINSALKADNETESKFRSNSIIDVYASKDGRYCFSFYLPDIDGFRLKDFAVTDNALIAIHGNFLVVYSIRYPAIVAYHEQR